MCRMKNRPNRMMYCVCCYAWTCIGCIEGKIREMSIPPTKTTTSSRNRGIPAGMTEIRIGRSIQKLMGGRPRAKVNAGAL